MRPAARVVLACALAAASSPTALAQRPTNLAAGRVMRPGNQGAPVPVAGQWVVLHRVGSDHAAPVDSARSGADGRYRIAYTPTGAGDALYFVSSRYAGIAYFSPPLRAATVRGGDADVMVYDTTTDTTSLRLQGRHFVLSAPSGAGREVAEVFELENEGTRTVVARDARTPLWTALLPAGARNPAVAPGDVGAGAVTFRDGRAELYAPISPGLRQLVVTYDLPPDAFPLAQPLGRPVAVLEVLLEEPRAGVEGASLAEVAAASIGGRQFRRFLASNVPGSAVMRVTAPPPIEQNRAVIRVLGIAMAAVMLAALVAWRRRAGAHADSRGRAAVARSPVESLVAQLAALDARLEKLPPDDAARAAYERERAELKARVERALAAEGAAV